MQELAVNNFTVKVGGFRLAQLEQDLINFINDYNIIRERTKRDNSAAGDFISNIVQIKIPEVEEIK